MAVGMYTLFEPDVFLPGVALGFAVLAAGVLVQAVIVSAVRWLAARPAARAAVCTCCHGLYAWKRLTRTPTGFADWCDTWECRACGDRWCSRL